MLRSRLYRVVPSILSLSLLTMVSCADSGGSKGQKDEDAMSSDEKDKGKDNSDEEDDDSGENSDGDDDNEDNSDPDSDNDDDADDKEKPKGKHRLTYYRDAKTIIDRKCANCHSEGDIGPFTLETYEEVYELRSVVKNSIESGAMPPWSPRKDCQEYRSDRSLSDGDKKLLLDWLEDGAPEGDPDDEVKAKPQGDEVEFNMELEMPETYTPDGLDVNRCFLIEWPGKKLQYQTAFQVIPGEPEMLHHLLVYKVGKDQVPRFKGFDSNDPGPGYNCPGGPAPGVHPNEVELIGDWVPGQTETGMGPGVGLRYQPGDLLIMQHHYNTAFSGKKPDRSKYEFRFVDEVERPTVASLFFNSAWLLPGLMSIPAGEKDASASYTFSVRDYLGKLAADNIPGVTANDELQIRIVAPHLHQLGSEAYVTIIREDGSEDCLVDIPKCDFDWQGLYSIRSKVTVKPGDKIKLECHWNNTAENQPPMPDGSRPDPQFVAWGDRTRDEMCLVGIAVSLPD